jgi:hypothetical protein
VRLSEALNISGINGDTCLWNSRWISGLSGVGDTPVARAWGIATIAHTVTIAAAITFKRPEIGLLIL